MKIKVTNKQIREYIKNYNTPYYFLSIPKLFAKVYAQGIINIDDKLKAIKNAENYMINLDEAGKFIARYIKIAETINK